MDEIKSQSISKKANENNASNPKKIGAADSSDFDDLHLSCIDALEPDYDVYESAYNSLHKSVLVACTMARYNEPQNEIFKFLRKAITDAENTLIIHLGIQRHAKNDLSFLSVEELLGTDKN